jgi:hypothetical protein
MSRTIFDHDELCPAAENDCGFGKEAHYIYDKGWACIKCEVRCVCDLIEKVLDKAAERVIAMRFGFSNREGDEFNDLYRRVVATIRGETQNEG